MIYALLAAGVCLAVPALLLLVTLPFCRDVPTRWLPQGAGRRLNPPSQSGPPRLTAPDPMFVRRRDRLFIVFADGTTVGNEDIIQGADSFARNLPAFQYAADKAEKPIRTVRLIGDVTP